MMTSPVAKPRAAARRPPVMDAVSKGSTEPLVLSRMTPKSIDNMDSIKTFQDVSMDYQSIIQGYPDEFKLLSLTELVEGYMHLLPLRVKAKTGFMAENEGDPTICVEDVYNIHAVKQSEVVTIVDCRRQKYNLPLHSAAKFSLLSEKPGMHTAKDLLHASTLPPAISALSHQPHLLEQYQFSDKEILIPIEIAEDNRVVRVFSISEQIEKHITRSCGVLFSSHSSTNKLFLSDIIQYAEHVLPCKAQLFISSEEAQLPKHLTSKPVTVHPKKTETSLIISYHKPRVLEDAVANTQEYIDIPMSIDIDVCVLRPESVQDDYVSLIKDSRALVQGYDPSKLRACVNANDDTTYVTQAQLFKALRQGYEASATKIKTSGIERDGHIYEPLSSIRQEPGVYQDVVFNSGDKSKAHTSPSTGSALYEDVMFKPSPLTRPPLPLPSKPRSNKPLVHLPVARETSAGRPMVPLPSLGMKPQLKHTRPIESEEVAIIPPLPTKDQNSGSESQTSTVNESSRSESQKPVKRKTGPPPVPKKQAEIPKQQSVVSKQQIEDDKKQPTAAAGNPPPQAALKLEPKMDDSPLNSINESLKLLLTKVSSIEQKQSEFERDIARLKHKDRASDLPLDITSMTQQDVMRLLDAMEMSQYKASFASEWVDGEVFKDLDDESLQELGVASKLHRIKLMKVITGVYSLDKLIK